MKTRSGFSLIEVMCAILILGVALVGLTEGITTALSSSKEAEVQTTAALLAAGQIEVLRSEGYLEDGVTEGDGAPDLPFYRWRQTVSPAAMDGLHEVVVVVENANTGQMIYDLRTLLFDPDYEGQDESEEAQARRKKRQEGAAP